MLYFEDLVIGTKSRSGLYQVSREEVIAFASQYDPQAFHLDDEAAEKTHFGRLSASGWHTCAMTMRLMVEQFQAGEPLASLGSPGIDELRWLKPVYPGDSLTLETELLEKRQSKSRPEMGITKNLNITYNQNGEAVLSMISNGLIAMRV